MILINSRKHLPDLVERLRARNIPVLADRQGLLLMQPVVQPLMAVLGLMARPTMRKAAVELARSPVVGMTEQHVHEVFVSLEDGQAALPHLIQHAPTERVQTSCNGFNSASVGGRCTMCLTSFSMNPTCLSPTQKTLNANLLRHGSPSSKPLARIPVMTHRKCTGEWWRFATLVIKAHRPSPNQPLRLFRS